MVMTQATVKGVAAGVRSLLQPVALTTVARGCLSAADNTISEVVLRKAVQGMSPQHQAKMLTQPW